MNFNESFLYAFPNWKSAPARGAQAEVPLWQPNWHRLLLMGFSGNHDHGIDRYRESAIHAS
jgi:hypothetical protein